MLEPRTYPEMIGKALVLEAEPFADMVDDDQPWAEGLFLTVVVGVLVGLAQLIGGLLLTASLPPAQATLETLIQGWRQLAAALGSMELAAGEEALRRAWDVMAYATGYGGGWTRLFVLITTPLALIVQWLAYGFVGHLMARMLGGQGRLNQTLGATALVVAPQVLLLTQIVPFVSVSSILLFGWGLIIAYRALEVAHELPWQRAVWAALLPLVVLGLATAALSALIGAVVTLGGI